MMDDTHSLSKKIVPDVRRDSEFIKGLKPKNLLTNSQAFQLYHHVYEARLTDILMNRFAAVRWVLGKKLFEKLCRKYIDAQASVNYNLQNFGNTFAEFLKDENKANAIPFIYDLARFEWVLKEIADKPSPTPFANKHIKELLHCDDFKIQFIDAVEIFESPYSVYEIWSQKNSPSYQFEDINWNHAESLLIYQINKKLSINPISTIEAEILNELKEGHSIASALADFSSLLIPDKVAQFYQLLERSEIIENIIILEK
ncbi:MAG: HvfC/BufC family peptide modification chaperone [Pseudobdellovibrionaceae bacterium]